LRIAVWHNLPSGGGKRALNDHVRGLVQRGHVVEAWCPPTADRGYLPLAEVVPEHVVDLRWPVPRRLSDRLQATLQTSREIAAMDAHCAACAAQIDAGGFDILFANACQFFRTTAIGRLSRTPSVIYLGEPFRWLYEALPRLPWLAPDPAKTSLRTRFVDWRRVRNLRVQAREESANAAAFGRILVNSYFSRESVLRAYGIDAAVCYLGIDPTQFRPLNLPRDDMVICLGSVSREKNPHLIIEAIGTVPPPRPRVVWIGNVVAGIGLDALRDFARARGVQLDVRLRVSHEELLDALNRGFAMVYAPRLEPFGLAPLEANACATPVVAVAEGGVRETIRDEVNGLLVDPEPSAIAAAVTRLRDDPALAQRLGTVARAEVLARWSLAAAVDRLEAQLLSIGSLEAPPTEQRTEKLGSAGRARRFGGSSSSAHEHMHLHE
jgi:glycosyltransferase involved in cell wall biosynthesis